ncbi:MAG: hypothetical protein JW797_08490 [Bradymonadales bacterium]|nr:hypothetical protein [Bradymonadales bacterium]
MFNLFRIALGAVAWGLGSSAGREAYQEMRRWTSEKGEGKKPSIDERIVQLEKELEALKAERTAQQPKTPPESGEQGESPA